MEKLGGVKTKVIGKYWAKQFTKLKIGTLVVKKGKNKEFPYDIFKK